MIGVVGNVALLACSHRWFKWLEPQVIVEADDVADHAGDVAQFAWWLPGG